MCKLREDTLNSIINLEAEMFKSLNTVEPITEDKIPPFKIMRWMTYSVLSDVTLISYLDDLKEAKQKGRNLLTEKYALIAGQIPYIKKNPIINDIVNVEVSWMKELAEKYPNTIKRESANAELFEKYALCELETWSDKSLELYYKDVRKAKELNKNLAEERYNNLYRRSGYGSLQDIEDKAKDGK